MKCISCGNDIPNASTSCPYCGKDVVPMSSAVPTYDTPEQEDFNAVPLVTQEDTPMVSAPVNAIPATPDSPVLPQDQGMQNAPMAPAIPVGSEVEIPPIPGSEEPKVEEKKEVINSMSPPKVAATAGMMTGIGESLMENETDGMRESSSALVAEEKKKEKNKKTGKIIIIVLLVLVLAAGGGFGYYYYTQTQTSSKRINAIIDQVFKFDNNINNNLTKTSGKYTISAEVTAGETISAKLSGIYALDVEKKILDYTFNLEKLDMGETKLIEKDPLNVELYLADSNAYVLLQNFYDKYIYTEVQGLDEIFENLGKNQVNYVLILNGFKEALKAGLNATNKTQAAKDVEIGDIKKKGNVITIVLNTDNVKTFVKAYINSLKNNENLLKEFAKISDEMSVDELKKNLDESLKDIDEIKVEEDLILEIYTASFGNEFYGVRLKGTGDNKDSKMEIYAVTDGYKFIFVDNKNEALNVTFTTKKQETSSQIDETWGISVVMPNGDDVVKIKLDINTVTDRTPKVERVNTKESIKMENMKEEDWTAIGEKITKFGNLGLVIEELINQYMGGGNNDDPWEVENARYCALATNCTNCANGYCDCQYDEDAETTHYVQCPMN